ncbi:MAG: bifunctional folylpolyglutamate synthase/dihydrofolate synthase [Lachnospiraceae bacterium]|nr:bifunctional folylpolyglutamate synthase/dihydrofolate synthase [Lachnospiraceae bacterium]
MKVMKYDECREWLEERRKKLGSVPGLDEVNKLLEAFGRPDKGLPIVHIAGTNGKGSIGYLLEHSLANSKIKVGRFLSPAVVDEREIILVNGKLVPKTVWERKLSEIIDVIEEKKLKATAFEIEFVLSLLIFKETECKIVILECGMGGKLDATNAIEESLVDIIASISIDHIAFLGDTLKDISLHKFGIIKETSKNVVLAPQVEEVEKYFDEYIFELCKPKQTNINIIKSKRKSAKFKTSSKSGNISQILSYKNYVNLNLNLTGNHQCDNAICVLDAIEVLKSEGFKITDNAVKKAFENAVWPGRFEIIKNKDYTFILDGAHNMDAVDRLFENINLYFTNRNLIYIIGMYKDKAFENVIEKYAPKAKAIVTVTPKDKVRAVEAFELGKIIKDFNPNVTAADSYFEALEIAKLFAEKKDVILIFGSLSFMGDFRSVINNK